MLTNSDSEYKPSKTKIKKELKALQELGEKLLHLNQDTLNTLDLSDRLKTALDEGKKIKSFSALKRQKKYIGKLIQDEDVELIEEKLQEIHDSQQKNTAFFHEIELWRDRLIKDSGSVTHFVHQYPTVDAQHLNMLLRRTKKEIMEEKAPVYKRKLFKFLREYMLHDKK